MEESLGIYRMTKFQEKNVLTYTINIEKIRKKVY